MEHNIAHEEKQNRALLAIAAAVDGVARHVGAYAHATKDVQAILGDEVEEVEPVATEAPQADVVGSDGPPLNAPPAELAEAEPTPES